MCGEGNHGRHRVMPLKGRLLHRSGEQCKENGLVWVAPMVAER